MSEITPDTLAEELLIRGSDETWKRLKRQFEREFKSRQPRFRLPWEDIVPVCGGLAMLGLIIGLPLLAIRADNAALAQQDAVCGAGDTIACMKAVADQDRQPNPQAMAHAKLLRNLYYVKTGHVLPELETQTHGH